MSTLAQGTIVAGRYRLERLLARGGMGSVWVARHLQLDVDVAIKFMTPQFAESADARARFEREAKASAQLRLANVVQVHDFGVEDGAPFLVMELLDGEDLETRLRREVRLTQADTLAILEPVCRALRRAHEMGLVHRDLKPGNVFLAREGSETLVKVLDFGIAKDTQSAFGAGTTKTGAMLGSPQYMSPEQVRSSNRVDHRSDLWSLGVIAFRCLTGQLPLPRRRDRRGAGGRVHRGHPDPPPRSRPTSGRRPTASSSARLARDLALRFQSAGELAAAFAAMAPGAQVVPPPPAGAVTAITGVEPPRSVAGPAQGPAIGTLSPSEHTQNRPVPARGSWTGVVLTALGAVLVLGLALAFMLRSRAPASAARAPEPDVTAERRGARRADGRGLRLEHDPHAADGCRFEPGRGPAPRRRDRRSSRVRDGGTGAPATDQGRAGDVRPAPQERRAMTCSTISEATTRRLAGAVGLACVLFASAAAAQPAAGDSGGGAGAVQVGAAARRRGGTGPPGAPSSRPAWRCRDPPAPCSTSPSVTSTPARWRRPGTPTTGP